MFELTFSKTLKILTQCHPPSTYYPRVTDGENKTAIATLINSDPDNHRLLVVGVGVGGTCVTVLGAIF